jgi:hypothetical protein
MTDTSMVETDGVTLPPEIVEGVEGEQQNDGAAELESRARRQGWYPKDQFRGKPGDWVDAATFLQRSETELPVLRDRLRTLDRRNERLDNDLREVKQTLTEFREFAGKAEERAYTKAKREIEEKMRSAAANADVPGVEAARVELDELNASKPVPPKAPQAREDRQAQADPVVDAWVNAPERSWFRTDATLNSVATAIHMDLQRSKPGLTLAENLAEVEREVKARFPEKFGNPRRQAAAVVATPGAQSQVRRSGKKTVADLPPEAKAALARFKRGMPDYKDEDYLKMYFEDEE